MTYVYDGSLEGFLTLVHQTYMTKKSATRIIKSPLEWNLVEETETIITNRTYAKKVLQSLQEKFEKRYFERIFHVFMCDTRSFERPLYDYIILGFRDRKNLADINHPSILYIEKLEKEYFRYLHKMYGFVRFEEIADGTLYTKIEGKFNILPLLGRHFMKRLDGQEFIIHDTQRNIALLSENSTFRIERVVESYEPPRSMDEKKFQKLWKTFFKSVAIAERRNPKLQKQWVSLLYRRYMTEFT